MAARCPERAGPTFRTCPLRPRPGSPSTRLLLLHQPSAGGSQAPCVQTRPVRLATAQPLPSSPSACTLLAFPTFMSYSSWRTPRILCDREWPLALVPGAVQVGGSPGTGTAVLRTLSGFGLHMRVTLGTPATSCTCRFLSKGSLSHAPQTSCMTGGCACVRILSPQKKKKSHKEGLPQLWSEGAFLSPLLP